MDPKQVRIVFMGTPGFAVESLRGLVENGYNVVGVITAPDKPSGRGLKVSETAVKQYAANASLPILQPEKLKNPEFLEQLKSLQPDLQVVVAFRMLPEAVWTLPPLGTFNLHGSLLPQYRGAAPINWAVINGEQETGVTTFLLSHEIDTGKIIFSENTPIGYHETAGDIHDRLMIIGAGLVLKTVDALATGQYKSIAQEEIIQPGTLLHPAPKLFRETMKICWDQPAETIRNLIRGLSPYPAAWTTMAEPSTGKTSEMKIFMAEKGDDVSGQKPGTIHSDGKTYLKVACPDKWLHITDLQIAGKKRMEPGAFLRGFPDPTRYIMV